MQRIKLLVYLKFISRLGAILFAISILLVFIDIIFTQDKRILSNDSLNKINIYNNTIIPSLNNIADKKFLDISELKFQIQSILEENNYLYFDDFINSLIESNKDSNVTEYWLPNGNLTPVSGNTKENISKIMDKPFDTEEKLVISLKRLIGVGSYNKYEKLLKLCIVKETETHKYLLKIILVLFISGLPLFFIAETFKERIEKKKKNEENEKTILAINEKINKDPKNINLELDAAQIRLNKYIDENQKYLKYIFLISIILILMGIVIIIIAALLYKNNNNINIIVIGGFFGVILEFISSIFLFSYKSTIQQALRNISTLEQINNVGLAMKILNTIEDVDIYKNEIMNAKIEISKLLIQNRSND